MAADPSDSSTSGDRPGGRRVADPESYNQQQRLSSINQARKRCEETLEQSIVRQVTDDDFDESDRQQVCRAVLYSYLTNIEWLMAQAGERELLEEKSLGTIVLEPPDDLVDLVDDDRTRRTRIVGSVDLEPYEEEIEGIQGYLTAPEQFEHSWTLKVKDRNRARARPTVRTVETYMPVHISMNAFRAANGFLSKSGFDAELKEDQHRAVVTNENLREVEQWRKKYVK